MKFYDADENKNLQVPENNNSSDNGSDWQVSEFFSSEDIVMNSYLKIFIYLFKLYLMLTFTIKVRKK